MFFRLSHLTITVFTDFPKVSVFQPGGPRIYLALVSSPLSQFTDHVFRIFDRSVSSGLRRQDPDTLQSLLLPSMGQQPNHSRVAMPQVGPFGFFLALATAGE